jgi:flavorubredoxin
VKARELKKGIYWVGAIDWDLRNFHGYLTQRGSTYNAYLIIDEKVTLVDTVKEYLVDDMFERIAQIIDPSKIDYIVSNHVEMDHSGGIPALMEKAPNATIVASPNGVRGLKEHYGDTYTYQAVKNGDVLALGERNINFVLTPMIHWPDNMVAYIPEEKLLFSNDAFGQHLASSERVDDEYPLDVIMEEARKYYANIVLPFGGQVKKALGDVGGLDIEMIAPSHGIVWKKHIKEIVEEYTKWASNETEKKAVICYDTMWGSTKKMAFAIQSVLEDQGYATSIYNVSLTHISDIMTDLITAEYICIGSPTLNNNMLPTVASFVTYLKGLAPKNRKAIAFGSFGWNGVSMKHIGEALDSVGFDVKTVQKTKYIPFEEELTRIKDEVLAAITEE